MAEESKAAARASTKAATDAGKQVVDASNLVFGRETGMSELAKETVKGLGAGALLADEAYEANVDAGTKISGDAIDLGLEQTVLSQQFAVDQFCCCGRDVEVFRD